MGLMNGVKLMHFDNFAHIFWSRILFQKTVWIAVLNFRSKIKRKSFIFCDTLPLKYLIVTVQYLKT